MPGRRHRPAGRSRHVARRGGSAPRRTADTTAHTVREASRISSASWSRKKAVALRKSLFTVRTDGGVPQPGFATKGFPSLLLHRHETTHGQGISASTGLLEGGGHQPI